jgi:hypothetical protein
MSLRYGAGLACGFLAIAGIWLGLLVASFGYYETYGNRVVGAWYQVKADALRARLGKPKIVLAGGSNVLYGLDAAALERELGVPCVNYGTHGGLPFDYMLDRWKQVTEPGDLLVISPEWSYLKRDLNDMNDVFTGSMLGADPAYFWKMNWRDQAQVLLTASFRRLMMPVFSSFRENLHEQDGCREFVRRCYLDENGDYIANAPELRDRKELARLMEENKLFNARRLAWASADSAYWKTLRKFVKNARRRGIQIAYASPSVLALPEVRAGAYRKFFADAEAHYRDLGLPVLTTQEQNIYPLELMFDSIYHLNAKGRAQRTAQLAVALAPLVKERFPHAAPAAR